MLHPAALTASRQGVVLEPVADKRTVVRALERSGPSRAARKFLYAPQRLRDVARRQRRAVVGARLGRRVDNAANEAVSIIHSPRYRMPSNSVIKRGEHDSLATS